jgi:hypothetical protein
MENTTELAPQAALAEAFTPKVPAKESALRAALSDHLGSVLTPEVAADIEVRSTLAATLFARPQKIERLAVSMLGLPQPVFQVRHYFSPGIYAREITIPKDVVLVGAVHRLQNMAILTKGRLRLVTDTGTVMVQAGDPPINCSADRENAALALEDSVWTNFFPNPNDETDPDKLVEMVSFMTASEIAGGAQNVQLLAMPKQIHTGEST